MQMTVCEQQFCDESAQIRLEFSGPVRFTCDGNISTMKVSHSIWTPQLLFMRFMPVRGRIVITGRFSDV